MLLAGLALVYIGRGLSRRKRIAWSISVGLAAASVFLNLGHNGAIVRAAFSAVIAFELWRQRSRFHARSDPFRLRFALYSVPVLAVALTAYGVVGLREFGHVTVGLLDAVRTTWQIAWFQDVPFLPVTARTMRFEWSLHLLYLLSAAFVLVAALAPVAWRRESVEVDQRVHDLAWSHGIDSMSFFAKQPDKRHFLIDDRAFLGYRVKGRVAIVAGDPIGHEEAIGPLVGRFVDLCRRNDWVPVFYEASHRYLETYRRAGLRWFKIGEEAVLPLASWSLEGGKVAKVRQFINKVKREAPDLQVREYRRIEPDPEIDDQLEEISAAWLAGKKGREMGFNLGIFSVEELADKRTMIAQHDIRGRRSVRHVAAVSRRPRRRARRDAAARLVAGRRHGHAHRALGDDLQARRARVPEPGGGARSPTQTRRPRSRRTTAASGCSSIISRRSTATSRCSSTRRSSTRPGKPATSYFQDPISWRASRTHWWRYTTRVSSQPLLLDRPDQTFRIA